MNALPEPLPAACESNLTASGLSLNTDGQPSVAVITVCRNALAELQVTSASVQCQAYSPLLHIVVDGGSTDGTVEWLRQHKNKFAVTLSEPDQGIYDAMNKAIDLSPNVDWFIFINAGDTFHANDVIQKSVPELTRQDIAFVFGDICITDAAAPGQNKIYKARRNSVLEMPGCHQACFVRAKYMKAAKFNLQYQVAGDLEVWLRSKREPGAGTAYVMHTIATIAPEGYSAQNEPKLQREYYGAIKKNIGYSAAVLWLTKRKLRRAGIYLKDKLWTKP